MTPTSPKSTRLTRMIANRKFIWGDGNYEIITETDSQDESKYRAFVKKLASPGKYDKYLQGANACTDAEAASIDLDLLLKALVQHMVERSNTEDKSDDPV